jgi:hypothetical protein
MTYHARSGSDRNHHTKERRTMDWKLEVVPVPITDVDRAKHFYSDPDGNSWVLQERPARD